MNTQDTPWWRLVWLAKMTLLWLCAALLVYLFCFVCYVTLNVIWWCFTLVHCSYSYISCRDQCIWYMFWAVETTGNVDAIPYNPGEYYQSVYVHHHYKVVHLAKGIPCYVKLPAVKVQCCHGYCSQGCAGHVFFSVYKLRSAIPVHDQSFPPKRKMYALIIMWSMIPWLLIQHLDITI